MIHMLEPKLNSTRVFCDEASIEMVRRRLHALGLRERAGIAFLSLTGSFDPVHVQHLRVLEVAKKHLESLGWAVVAGFLAPSSQAYVAQKNGAFAWSLEKRIRFCQIATQDAGWMGVCVQGEMISYQACQAIRRELEHHCGDLLKGHRLAGVEIMGTDTLFHIFCTPQKDDLSRFFASREPLPRGRMICYASRPGMQQSVHRRCFEELASYASAKGVALIPIVPQAPDPPFLPMNSSAIRPLIAKRDWQALRVQNWLPPAVLKVLERENL